MGFILHLISAISMLTLNCLGYNLVFGKGRVLHFGPLAVSITATYGTYIIRMNTGSWAMGLGLSLILSLLVSAFFAWLSFRLEPDGLGILTIAVHLAFLAVILNWTDVTRGALGIPRIPRFPFMRTPLAFAAVSTVIAGLWIAFLLWLDRSPFGRKMAALAESEPYAAAVGISRKNVHMIAFLIAGIGAWLSNILYPQYVGLAHPNDLVFAFTIFYIMCVVAGGPGRVIGVTIATVLLTILKEGLRFLPLPSGSVGPLRLILFGMILLLAVWLRRKEMFPMARTV